MPDELPKKVADFARALPAVKWAEVSDIKRRARTRTIRAAAIGPLAGVAISGLIWATLPATPSVPTAGASPSPSASPSVSVSPAWTPPAITIPQRALLQPEDAGAGYRLESPYIERAGAGRAWILDLRDNCPGYAALNITAYSQAIVMVGHILPGPETISYRLISLGIRKALRHKSSATRRRSCRHAPPSLPAPKSGTTMRLAERSPSWPRTSPGNPLSYLDKRQLCTKRRAASMCRPTTNTPPLLSSSKAIT